MSNALTNEEFLKRLQKVHPGYTALEKYQKANIKIAIVCDKGHIFKAKPTNVINGHKTGCHICAVNRQRTTNKDFLNRLQNIHPGYIALEEYKTNHTKIKFKCDQGHIFEAEPNSIINRGTGCRICAFKKLHQCQAMPKTQFVQKLQQINPTIELISQYTKSSDQMQFKCTKCNYIWKTKGTKLISSNPTGCPKCAKARIMSALRLGPLSTKLSHNQFVAAVRTNYPTWSVISNYNGLHHKITIKCNKNHTFTTYPQSLLRHQVRCRRCDYLQRKSNVIHKLKKIHPGYRMISKFTDVDEKATFICDQGHKFKAQVYSVINNTGCPICSKRRVGIACRLTSNEFKNKLHKVHPFWKILSEYETMKSPMLLQCHKGHIFKKAPENALRFNCPDCNIKSKGEENIKQYLKTHNIPYTSPFVPNTCKDKNPLHFDFKINNILIEFQGLQHYKPIDHFGGIKQFKTQLRHDEIKRTWAKANNYTEIEIKYNDNINNILDSIFNKKYIE